MAVTASLTVTSPDNNGHVSATYVVTGNVGQPGGQVPVTGVLDIGGESVTVTATFSEPAVPPATVVASAPTAPGWIFTATSDPLTFTGVPG